jgi:glycosyltransferase involved in cell wall biosynthesis
VGEEAPYDNAQFAWLKERHEYDRCADKQELLQRLKDFEPDVIYVCSWHIPEYRFILKKYSGKALRILFMDNPWKGTGRQWMGVLGSRWYVRPLYEAVFVPGERQVAFAKKLGFPEERILRGSLSCDHGKFAVVHRTRLRDGAQLPKAFIYVGRFSTEKGVEVLAEAYSTYRLRTSDPWPLLCYGAGKLGDDLKRVEGVHVCGFLQPDELPSAFALASCLVLPSLLEPWGIVIHEASAAGLSVICSSACGASVHLVQDGYSGYVVAAGDSDHLAAAMLRYTALSEGTRKVMSDNSYNLSLQFTPARWATYFFEGVREMMVHPRLC